MKEQCLVIKLILFYFRFLDDLFFVWIGTLEELREYEIYLNSLIPDIKITFTACSDNVDFLDTMIYKFNESENVFSMKTRVFFKETDIHQLLHKLSFHPKHTFKSVLKNSITVI